jgi:tRNA(Leu) C34 or U34 (ribose-2'-O)-methylase TrmL
MDVKKWFEDQKIEPVQDRADGMDYWKNYELFTYNDLMECLEALYSITAVVQAKPEKVCAMCNQSKEDDGHNCCEDCGGVSL